MTKEQRIEEMALLSCCDTNKRTSCTLCSCSVYKHSKKLIELGYGNLREFVKKSKDGVSEMTMENSSEYNAGYNEALNDVENFLDELLKEYLQ